MIRSSMAIFCAFLMTHGIACAGWNCISAMPPRAFKYAAHVKKGTGSYDDISITVGHAHYTMSAEVYDYGNLGAGGTVEGKGTREYTKVWTFVGALGADEPGFWQEYGLAKIRNGTQVAMVYITLMDGPAEAAAQAELVWKSNLRPGEDKVLAQIGGATGSTKIGKFSSYGLTVDITSSLGESTAARVANSSRNIAPSPWKEVNYATETDKTTAGLMVFADSIPPTGANAYAGGGGVQDGGLEFDSAWR